MGIIDIIPIYLVTSMARNKGKMKNHISNTGLSFQLLAESSDFLNIVLDNITSCILLLDNEMRLQAYNNALKTIFSGKRDEDLLYQYCGNAIGCAYQVEENSDCGSTSRCGSCDLRISAMESYTNDVVIFKDKITRPFFKKTGEKVDKDLQFSTRLFVYNNEKFIIVIIEDITKLKQSERALA